MCFVYGYKGLLFMFKSKTVLSLLSPRLILFTVSDEVFLLFVFGVFWLPLFCSTLLASADVLST